jgi:hypothetical protein
MTRDVVPWTPFKSLAEGEITSPGAGAVEGEDEDEAIRGADSSKKASKPILIMFVPSISPNNQQHQLQCGD